MGKLEIELKQERIMKEGKGRGRKECKVPPHLTKNSIPMLHALLKIQTGSLILTGKKQFPPLDMWRRSQECPSELVEHLYHLSKDRHHEDHPDCSRRNSARRSRRMRPQSLREQMGNLRGVCPLIGGTNIPLAHQGVIDSFDTYRIVPWPARIRQ